MAIVGTLPYTLTNGTLANADEVMGDLNFIAAQVNANAAAGGAAVTANVEWTLLTDAPTYVSATSFTMTGDQTATFTIGRRVRSINTGGTTYSTVIAASVVLNTTITVVNSSGTLDSGMNAVSIGTLNSVNPSLPALTNFTTQGVVVLTSSGASFALPGGSTAALGDVLHEWVPLINIFAPKISGLFRVTLDGYLSTVATTIALGTYISIQLEVSTVFQELPGSAVSWPYATGSTSYAFPFHGSMVVPMTAGQYGQLTIAATYSGGNPIFYGTITWQRLAYPT